jgi:hypothetical protein
MSREKYPCPNCNREIFPGTAECPYCNVSLSILMRGVTPERFTQKAKDAAKPSQVLPIWKVLAFGSALLFSAICGFIAFILVNLSPFTILTLDYSIGTVALTVLPGTICALVLSVYIESKLRAWIIRGIGYPRRHPDRNQILFTVTVLAGSAFSVWYLR